MLSSEMCAVTSSSSKFTISSKEIEGLVLEIKENLRLSASSGTIHYKAIPRTISRKSLRGSPYNRPPKCCNKRDSHCIYKYKSQEVGGEDPYEVLQKLIKDGSLVNEAVRRVQLGLTTKQFYYDSDDECRTPIFHLIPQEN